MSNRVGGIYGFKQDEALANDRCLLTLMRTKLSAVFPFRFRTIAEMAEQHREFDHSGQLQARPSNSNTPSSINCWACFSKSRFA